MANFPPFKAYILRSLDRAIFEHGLRPPFLDIGCGVGDVSKHLAKRGWQGIAVDSSLQALEVAEQSLSQFKDVEVLHAEIAELNCESASTAVMFDVLEHVQEDYETLCQVAKRLTKGGTVVLTVPANPREWRWDDEFYGHLRRYSPDALASLLQKAGFEVLSITDISFPFFWVMRRGFTWIKRPGAISGKKGADERTSSSSLNNAWEMGPLGKLLSYLPLWKPLFFIQRRFRRFINIGCEVMVVARVASQEAS